MERRHFVTLTTGAVIGGALGGITACSRATGGSSVVPAMDVAAFRASRRFADLSYGRIAYVERGRGGRAALFLHGLPLNGYQWRGALDRLQSARRCIAPDFMGLGYSEVPEGADLSPEAQTRMLAAFLDALGVNAVDLVASDSGGAVAQLFVAWYPRRVRTLLLTNCDVHEDSPPPTLARVIAAARAATLADGILAPQLADHAVARRLPNGLAARFFTYPDRMTAETLACYLTPLLSSPLRKAQCHGYIVALDRNPLLAIEPELRRSQVPMRVVWGTADPIFAASGPAWLDRTFSQSRGVRLVEGASLFFQEEMPDLIAEEARRLWTAG
jgi:pimeloyl-ACP methyl ester carboxylesterase